jgi:hypothetical protein
MRVNVQTLTAWARTVEIRLTDEGGTPWHYDCDREWWLSAGDALSVDE